MNVRTWCVTASMLFALPVFGGEPSTLTVFAAASLDGPFRELAREFERAEPGVRVRLNLAGSQQLAAQLRQGAKADVFASADARWMAFADSIGVLAAPAMVFAHNSLTVIVPGANPAHITRLQDLARPGIKLVLGAEAVPVGHYSRAMLRNLAQLPGYAPDFAPRVLANTVSEEENVRAVANKVQLGEADAGIVYRSDVTLALARHVREFAVPDAANVVVAYHIAILRSARDRAAAGRFVAMLRSPKGRAILARYRMKSALTDGR
ncbi:MAG: molybdate ABC transporter substrate-binding protein [Candidatus Eisenbacteria bacterium]